MKPKVIPGSAVVLTSVIGVSIITYVAITNSRLGSAPTQSSQENSRSTTNEAPSSGLSSREVNEASEKKTGGRVTPVPQPITQPSTAASLTPSQTISASPTTTDKFSGTWVLDKARSEGIIPGMNQIMIVSQSGSVINVKTILSAAEKGEWTVTDAYTLNGRETEFAAPSTRGGIEKGKRIARLTNDGNGIEVNERAIVEQQGASIIVNTTRRWMIADDKSLVIEMNVGGPDVTWHHKRVFVKR